MDITKYAHSCVRLQSDDGALVIDPGNFSGADELKQALDGVEAVLVTHEHPDHLDVDTVSRLLHERPDLRIWGPAPVAGLFPEHRDRVNTVGVGESFAAGGLAVSTHGGQHALIHPSIPVVPNLAYLVAGSMFHPGDAFTVPAQPVDTLLLAVHAPWSRVGEVLDHLIAVRADTVHAIHDGLLNDRGRALVDGHVDRVAAAYGSAYVPLAFGQTASG